MGKKKNGNAPNKVVKHRNLKKTKTQKRNKDKEDEIRKMLNSQIDLIVMATNGTLKNEPKKMEKIGLPAEVPTDEIESLMTKIMSRLLSARLDLSKCAKLTPWRNYGKSRLLHVSVRFQSADSTAVGPEPEKLRKSYKMMRPVRPSDDILAPRQYLHMMQQTDIQHTRWKLQGGWKKKVAWLSIILGLVCYIYWYTLEIFKRDSFYAELEAAENESRELEGRMPLGYNISDPKDDEEFE